MTLHSSQIVGGTDTALASLKSTTEHKKSTSTSFSKALKDASSTTDDSSSTSTADTTTAKAPSSEKSTAVDGHKYATITAGPRKGMFLNTGTNARHGDAFVMVRKNGREYHIYGTGSHRTVIGMKTAADKTTDATDTSSTDPTTSTGTTDTTDAGKINTDTSTTS
jgi:hypothetical protein